MTPRQRDWALDSQSFEKLLLLLDSDREKAGVQYETIRARLLRIFEWRGCRSPETLADQTMDRVSRRLENGEIIRAEDPAVYFYGVARNVLKEYWTGQQKEAAARRFELPTQGLTDSKALQDNEIDDRMGCLERCLAKLPSDSQELITLYYRSEKTEKIEDRMRLARTLGISPGTLRIRAHRIRKALESCVGECMRRRADG
jgi:DNA-directed RNA polymerase specialized sigma24 family protein